MSGQTHNDKSPCVGTCLYDPAESECMGCFRTPKEITEWSKMTRLEKLRVKERIHGRKNSRWQGR